MGRKTGELAMIAAVLMLGACHDQQTRERIRDGDFDPPVENSAPAPAAPAPSQPQ